MPNTPDVVLSSTPSEQPLAFVTLAQVPVTGVGSTLAQGLFWLLLAVWSAGIAYLLTIKNGMRSLGRLVREAWSVLAEAALLIVGTRPRSTVSGEEEQEPRVVREYVTRTASSARRTAAPAVPAAATESGGILIFEEQPGGSVPRIRLRESVSEDVAETSYEEVEQTAPTAVSESFAPQMNAQEERAGNHDSSAPAFLNDLVRGRTDVCVGTLEQAARDGQTDVFLTDVVCAIDDCYRQKKDGSRSAHPDVAEALASCSTATLENLLDVFTTAFDTAYSDSRIGAKVAVTRARAALNR